MEKKRKQDQNVSETETDHHILSKDDQIQDNAEPLTQSTSTNNPLNCNATSLSHQYPVTYPWPYTPQHGGEQSPLASRPCVVTQSPLPGIISQWPQFPHQVQHGQPPRTYPQSAAPFWPPQQPGYPLPASDAPSTFQPFVAVGTTDISGGTNQPQVPNFYYHVGYPYQGFPGSCDSPPWWNQAQPPQPLCTYAFPGGFNPSPPALLSNCSTTLGQAVGKGIIRPPAKLSNKHQQLWDAQSAENVQLWGAVNQLQSEVTDYKNRLTRLEAELSSLKAVAEETTAQVSGAVLSAKPSKRGRPKRSVVSADAVQSPDKPHRRAHGRKPAVPAVCNAQQFGTKSHLFEKVILNKVESKDKECHLTPTIEQGNNASHVVTHSGGNMEINGTSSTIPTFHYQLQPELAGVQTCGNGSFASSEMKDTDIKANNCRTTYPIFPQNIPWPFNNTSEIERNELNIGPNGMYNNGIVSSQQIIPGWSFVNEEDTSEKLEDAVLGSGKKDNEETMGGESISIAEKFSLTSNVGGFNMNDREGTSSKSLAPPSN